ncbi:MAG TPA: hypothetical protein VHE11_16430 [Steroidobacteraceae bacterium]|nr:hypothetical protein [Steroidobacteraceae bacterium]
MTRCSPAPWLAALALTLASCARHGAPAPGTAATSPAAGGAVPWAGHVLRGSDPQVLRQYLLTVREVKPIRFRVRWNPATVAIDKQAALRSLRSVSRDGSTFVFASREPAVGKLKAGSILWVWDLALRKVDRVAAAGGLTRVHTIPVALTEAIPDADIEFDARAPISDFLLSGRPADTAPPGAAPPAGTPASPAAPAPPRSGTLQPWRLRPVLYQPDDSGTRQPQPPDTNPSEDRRDDSNDDADEDADDEEEDHFQGNTYKGTLKGYEFSIGYAPSGDDALRFRLEARKADEQGEGDDSSEPAESEAIKEKHEELEKDEKEVREEISKLHQEEFEQQEGLNHLDETYEKQLEQMRQDEKDRNDPSYTGPTPPPHPSDSNGTPLTEQAMEAKLTAQYEKERGVELQKQQQVSQILAQAEIRKADLRHQLAALGKALAKHAKDELFDIVSDNLDIRFKADAELSGFDVAGVYQFAGGDIEKAQLQLKNLNGTVRTDFVARLGKSGNQGSKIPVIDIPVVFDLPMPIGGIPFVCQIGTDFLINVYLAGYHATLNLTGQFQYNGTDGFTYGKSQSSYDDTLAASNKPAITLSRGASPGVSAAVLGIQIPRWGFGLGMWGVSSLAYFDIIHVFTMTKSADVAIGLAAPPCLRTTYAASGDVGIETQALPIPIESVQSFAKNTLSGKKQIFNLQSEKLEPPIKACEIGS